MEMALFNNRPAPRETGVCGAGRQMPSYEIKKYICPHLLLLTA